MNYCTAFSTKTDKEQVKNLKVTSGCNLGDIKHQHQKKFKKHGNFKLRDQTNLGKFSNKTIQACLQSCDKKSIIYEKNDVDQQLISLQRGLTQSQLEHCMMQIVQDLNNAPLIQAVSTSRFLQVRHLHVSERTISSPFVWFEIQSQLGNFDPEMLILVNEIDSPVAKCPYSSQFENQKFKMLPTCSLGIQNQQSSVKWETDLVHGKFGDCCEEDENHNNVQDFQGQGQGQRQHPWPQQKLGINQDSNLDKISTRSAILNQNDNSVNLHLNGVQERDQSSNLSFDRNFQDEHMKKESFYKDASPGQVSRYWGVVIQSKEMSLMDGCYLLTTTQNRGQHGCTCTHFHLTRVCQGVSLDNQLRNSWLGQQFVNQVL